MAAGTHFGPATIPYERPKHHSYPQDGPAVHSHRQDPAARFMSGKAIILIVFRLPNGRHRLCQDTLAQGPIGFLCTSNTSFSIVRPICKSCADVC